MIIQSESFLENEAGTMNGVAEFLGLGTFELQAAKNLQRSWDAGAGNALQLPQNYSELDDAVRRLLTKFFKPYNRQLYRLIDGRFDW